MSCTGRTGKVSTYVSFSNVTVALCGLSAASDVGVTEREVILPLLLVSLTRNQET